MKPDIGSIPAATPGHGCAPPLGATALCQPGGKAHGRLAKTVLCEKLKKKCRRPKPGQPFCASRACAVETHMEMSQGYFMQGFAGKIPRPNAGTTDDHRFAQSKCTWTSRKNRFIREFTEKMPRPKTGTTVLCEPGLRSRNAHGHAAGAILRNNLQEKYRAPTPGQPFCAIEMHMDISQVLFYGGI